MRVPLSWLAEYAELPQVSGRELADRLVAAGLEVQSVEQVGHELEGIVVGEVLEIEELTGFKKPIRHCRVDAGEDSPRGIVCGATNFAVGDRVPVVLPGGVLPGGFKITARKTYGHVSEGMICSEAELGLADSSPGILVLPPDSPVGADFVAHAGLRDEVLDIAVTPDRGDALSIRGLAREAALAYGVPFRDPADVPLPAGEPDPAAGPVAGSYPASIADPTGCDRFVLREVRGLRPEAQTPPWMRVRLVRAGMRPVSLAVDVTNYLMHELGNPLHAFDRGKLSGPIVVRRAAAGERLETLDHVVRELHPEDVLIADDSGPISMAGTMGGLHTEIDERSTHMVIEGAHFSASATARMSRRHDLHSEASDRFERGVDRELPRYATAKAARLLAELGGAEIVPGVTQADAPVEAVTITMPAGHPGRVAGLTYPVDTVVRRLRQVGCEVAGADATDATGAAGAAELTVTPPSWRPDLTGADDLAEEVIRLEGYDKIPSRPPRPAGGTGLTAAQRLRRRVGRGLAAAGYVEVLSPPFTGERDADALQLPADDPRRDALRMADPPSADEPLLRTTLLPGLLRTLARNVSRGFPDAALYELGTVYRPSPGAPVPRPAAGRARTGEEPAALEAAPPDQPLRVAVVLCGQREPAGWQGAGRAADWTDAVEAARLVLGEARLTPTVRADRHAPWHPGRCAALLAGDTLVGHAGELHPRVAAAYDLPPRTCAMELELTRLEAMVGGVVVLPRISTHPVAIRDVALVVGRDVPASRVEAALRTGAGELLESVRLFDVYTGDQVGAGSRSLAYTLRLRAPDRTLTTEEASAACDAAVEEAARSAGAVLRG